MLATMALAAVTLMYSNKGQRMNVTDPESEANIDECDVFGPRLGDPGHF
jgi:hypothetical protein